MKRIIFGAIVLSLISSTAYADQGISLGSTGPNLSIALTMMHRKVCTGLETETLSGTYKIVHPHYTTIGPVTRFTIKKCVQYDNYNPYKAGKK